MGRMVKEVRTMLFNYFFCVQNEIFALLQNLGFLNQFSAGMGPGVRFNMYYDEVCSNILHFIWCLYDFLYGSYVISK